MTDPLRLGLIGVDSSHALSFDRLLGDGRTGEVPGAVISSAWRGPTSLDLPPSRKRNDANAEELQARGLTMADAPEQVADDADALLLVTADVRTRRAQFERIVGLGLPVFVDTRFATTAHDAKEMLDAAERAGCLVLGGSPKRFAAGFHDRELRPARAVDLTGSMVTQPGHPGLAWYGVHLVDLAVALLGVGCRRIEPVAGRLVLTWQDGRTASIGGPAEWGEWTRGSVTLADAVQEFEIKAQPGMLGGILRSIIEACRTGVPNIPAAEILEITTLVQAGTAALERGAAVEVESFRV